MEGVKIEDYECALCLKLLCNPCCIPCGHSFCQFCLQQTIDSHARDNQHSPLQCPLCRSTSLNDLYNASTSTSSRSTTSTSPSLLLKPNVILCQLLSTLFPTEYKSRLEEVTEDSQEYLQTVITTKTFTVGNIHRIVHGSDDDEDDDDENCHEWKYFVRMNSLEDTRKYIDKVVIELHPTFRPSTITLNRPPFVLTRIGWGIFQINSTIYWKSCFQKAPERVTWMLSFEGNGDMTEHTVQFTERVIPPSIQQQQSTSQQQQVIEIDDDEEMS